MQPTHPTHQAIRRLVANGHDLSVRQIDCLLSCHVARDKPEVRTVRSLAKALNISKPAITRGLDRLELEGFGSRKHDPLDRRSIIFSLSSKGASLANDILSQAKLPKAA